MEIECAWLKLFAVYCWHRKPGVGELPPPQKKNKTITCTFSWVSTSTAKGRLHHTSGTVDAWYDLLGWTDNKILRQYSGLVNSVVNAAAYVHSLHVPLAIKQHRCCCIGGYGLFQRRTLGSNPDSSLSKYKQPASQPASHAAPSLWFYLAYIVLSCELTGLQICASCELTGP